MATLYDLKPRFQGVLRPLARGLADHGVTANAVTLAALLLSLAYGSLLWASGGVAALLLGLPAFLLLRMALNALDGLLAREQGQASLLGGRLNEFGDVVSDLALYLPFALLLTPGWPVALAILGGVLAEFAGLAAQAHGGERRYDGPFGKADRAALFGLTAVAQATVGLDPLAVTLIFLMASAAAAVTCLRRLLGGTDHA